MLRLSECIQVPGCHLHLCPFAGRTCPAQDCASHLWLEIMICADSHQLLSARTNNISSKSSVPASQTAEVLSWADISHQLHEAVVRRIWIQRARGCTRLCPRWERSPVVCQQEGVRQRVVLYAVPGDARQRCPQPQRLACIAPHSPLEVHSRQLHPGKKHHMRCQSSVTRLR